MARLALWFAALASIAAGCSSTPKPVEPDNAVDVEPKTTPDAASQPDDSEPSAEVDKPLREEPEVEPTSEPKPEAPARAVPHDITPNDCEALGGQLARVTRNDQLAELSPRLDADKRRAAEEGIREVAQKVGERWTEYCQKSLAGGTTDEASLKCAMRSKTADAFTACLSGPAPAK